MDDGPNTHGLIKRCRAAIATAGGRWVDLIDPQPETIELDDIAHALGNLCRFGGQCRTFYSVAQHSVWVARTLEAEGYSAECQLAGLLHDASEAYVVDVPRPLKQLLHPGYADIETRVKNAIGLRFFATTIWPAPVPVKTADEAVLFVETKALMPGSEAWAWDYQRIDAVVDEVPSLDNCWKPARAQREFAVLAQELMQVSENGAVIPRELMQP